MYRTEYYYSKLSADKRKLYRQVCKSILNFETEVRCENALCITDLSDSDDQLTALSGILDAVMLDHPEIYYVNRRNIMYTLGCSPIIHLSYLYSPSQVRSINEDLRAEISRIVDGAKAYSTPLEQERYVYDYFVKNETYTKPVNPANVYSSNYVHSIYGVLKNRTAVCEGLAKAFQLCMNRLGIDCIIVIGTGDPDTASSSKDYAASNDIPNHAWNMVKIGNWYHVDVTWGINISDNTIRYDYFNLSEKEIRQDHDHFHGVPSSVHSLEHEKMLRRIHKPEEMKKLLIENFKNGAREICFTLVTDQSFTQAQWKDKIPVIITKMMDQAMKECGMRIRSYQYSSLPRGDEFNINISF